MNCQRRSSAEPDPALSITNAIEIITTVPKDSIKVAVHEGWVTLSGAVKWRSQKEIVELVVRRLSGVRGITSSIMVA